MAEDDQQVTLASVAHDEVGDDMESSASRSTRKRPSDGLCVLADERKSSLANKRTAALGQAERFQVGDAVGARYKARQGGKLWYRGKVMCVHEIPPEAGGPARTYDIKYNDGDHEPRVMSKYVRRPSSDDVP